MNKTLKFGVVAAALAMTAPAFADAFEFDTSTEVEAEGWTVFELGLASPVQLPWGSHEWDIYGIGANVIWNDAPKMYGLGFGGLAMLTRNSLKGVQVSALCNWTMEDAFGIRATLGGNIAFGKTFGFEAGGFGFRKDEVRALDIEFLGSYQPYFWGIQVAGLCNYCTQQSYGGALAIGANIAKVAYGCDISIFNYTQELHGLQVGLVNYAKECPSGLQIGLLNIITDNKLKFLPICNWYF